GAASVAKWVYTGCIKGATGATPTVGTNMTSTFSQASTRANIASGETHGVLFGKIAKWFADLKAAAFAQMISSYSDMMANTASGYVPDALAVKQGFAEVNSNLSHRIVGHIAGLKIICANTALSDGTVINGSDFNLVIIGAVATPQSYGVQVNTVTADVNTTNNTVTFRVFSNGSAAMLKCSILLYGTEPSA
nr:hypothetical protein [Acetatifactor sp.]